MSFSLSACGSIASGRGGKEEELADSRAELCATSAISGCDESAGFDREVGTRVGSRAQTQRRKVVEVFHLHQASYGCHAKGLAHGQEMRWVEMAKVSRHEHGDA
jgi:hypothetical protein